MGPSHCFSPTLLSGKRALITGGGTGLGKAIAFELARSGADLVLASRRLEVLEATAAEIKAETGREVDCLQVNIRDLDTVATLAETISDRWGQMDILVNNAGGQFVQPAEEYSANGWRTVIDLNLNGTWNMTQALGQQMLKGHGGCICNIVVTLGRGMPGIAHTTAARAGIVELSRSLSYEWGPKVRITNVGPGSVITEAYEDTYDESVLASMGENPIPHAGAAEDIANAVVFLVSPTGRFITGETLMVDGGVSRYGKNQALMADAFPHRKEIGPDWEEN